MRDILNYSLLSHNTFGIEASCDRFVEFSSVDELVSLVSSLKETDYPLLILGGGSNLLLTGDYHGTVIHSAVKGISLVENDGEHVVLRVGSGEVFDDFVSYCVDHGYYGAENLSIIPGEVGASAVQNIGAYGVEAKDIIVKVEAVEIATGKTVEFSNADCQYAYRQSRFKGEWYGQYVITYVSYRLSTTFVPNMDYGNIRAALAEKNILQPTAKDLRNIIIEIRNAKLPDPKVEGNAGSFFMNPIVSREKYLQLAEQYPNMPHYFIDEQWEKIPAGWMIDHCGWKGHTLGRAGVHSKQALVLVNRGGATGQDIVRLCKTIQDDVYARFGIHIEPEVNIR